MSYKITQESFDSLSSLWADSSQPLKWNSVFVLPVWMRVWWQELGPDSEPYLISVRDGERIIGIAPLRVENGTASIIGSTDVCDYLDFVVVPGMEKDFFTVLLDNLDKEGIYHLDLKHLRPDSLVLNHLVNIARNRGDEVVCNEDAVSLELDLPSTWEEYLATLSRKQRHEVRRKLRRLGETGHLEYHCYNHDGQERDLMDIFLKLFSMSQEEKASFMTARMESFFRALVKAMAELGLLRFGILEIDNTPAAMTMSFDYDGAIYLYNSAYDPQYNSLSVGLLCKLLCLKESIEEGRAKWDFLKGGEPYKYQIGGREIPLYSCQINIK